MEPSHQNGELFVRVGMNVFHNWRESWAGPWNSAGVVRSTDDWRGFPSDVLDCPAVVQSTFNRNFELIYRASPSQLRHVYYDQASKMWTNGWTFGPMDPSGIPGFVQGNRGAPGDFEVVLVRATGAVEHWTKHNSSPWTRPPGTWYLRDTLTGKATAGRTRLGIEPP